MVERLIMEYNQAPITPSAILSPSLLVDFERRVEMARRVNPDFDPSRQLTDDIFHSLMRDYAPKPQCRLNCETIFRYRTHLS